ncbi:hypothetical protein A5641_21085 [Mycobacterium sp. 1554424.7]|nr:hypothetical protein A5641_21085 [Mycobacterium sp. 1554424.7]
MTVDPVTPTPSLRRRVVIVVVGLLAVLLVMLGVVIDVAVRSQAQRSLNDRLLAATSRADALAQARTPPQQIAAQLNGGSVRALVVTADGAAYGDPAINPETAGAFIPPPGPPPPGPGGPGGPFGPPPPGPGGPDGPFGPHQGGPPPPGF